MYIRNKSSFNSTLVQLKVLLQIADRSIDSCFNSTLVQLKGVMVGYLERK